MRLAVVFVAMLGLLALGCDAGEDHAAVAEQVAGQWAEDSMEEAVDLVVELVMDSPVVSEALESVPSLAAGAAKYALGRLIAEQRGQAAHLDNPGGQPTGGRHLPCDLQGLCDRRGGPAQRRPPGVHRYSADPHRRQRCGPDCRGLDSRPGCRNRQVYYELGQRAAVLSLSAQDLHHAQIDPRAEGRTAAEYMDLRPLDRLRSQGLVTEGR